MPLLLLLFYITNFYTEEDEMIKKDWFPKKYPSCSVECRSLTQNFLRYRKRVLNSRQNFFAITILLYYFSHSSLVHNPNKLLS